MNIVLWKHYIYNTEQNERDQGPYGTYVLVVTKTLNYHTNKY